MLGEQIGEMRGRRTGRRVLSVESGFKVEVTFEDKGKLMGIEGANIGTYTAVPRADGTLCGEGQGVFTTPDGDMVTWRGVGTGMFKGGGPVSYRGALTYDSTSRKFTQLNTLAGVFEFEVDADGNTHSKIWAWK